MESLYLYCSSQQDRNYFSNTGSRFSINLPYVFHFNNCFEVCVKEIRLARRGDLAGYFLLSADILQTCPVFGEEHRVLATFDLSEQPGQHTVTQVIKFPNPDYMPIDSSTASSIRFDIVGIDNADHHRIERVWLVLHIRAKKQ